MMLRVALSLAGLLVLPTCAIARDWQVDMAKSSLTFKGTYQGGPFEGKFATVVPHVTVAHADEAQLCEIEVELRIALASGSPLRARCSEMVLIENSSGRWEELQRFPLGPS